MVNQVSSADKGLRTNEIDCTHFAHKNCLRQLEKESNQPTVPSPTMFISKADFDLWAVKCFTNQYLSFCFEKPSKLSERHFRSLFLYSSEEVAALWATLYKRSDFPLTRPEELLWALYYLKVYPTWDQMAMTTGKSEKTLRKWVGIAVDYLAGIDDFVSIHTRVPRTTVCTLVQSLCSSIDLPLTNSLDQLLVD
jgi:hypothetical protein